MSLENECVERMLQMRGVPEYQFELITHSIKKSDVKTTLKTFLETAKEDGHPSILVLGKGCTVSKKVMEEIKECYPNVEFFTEEELLMNPLSHAYSPKSVRVLSEIQKKQFLKDMQVSFDKLPQILKTDPLSRYFGASVGQILEIERCCQGMTTGRPITYRRVV